MGRLMSARLAQAGYALNTFDKNGSGTHPTARSAAEGADILITMLPDGKVVRRVVRAALPALRTRQPGRRHEFLGSGGYPLRSARTFAGAASR